LLNKFNKLKQIILLSLLRCQSSIFSMNFYSLSRSSPFNIFLSTSQSGCKNKTFFSFHLIKNKIFFRWSFGALFQLELRFENSTITVFKRLQKYNQI
ncbi:hypothetical protein QWY87_04540, partial [Lutimonas halocynthiae]|uniref:hypothetical protein n=1 Tax=Lutimonas halocynthiae TaxID=1446477 RepID=UPI0025B50772